MPIWYRNRAPNRIRCTFCQSSQRGCSLGGLADLGVGRWPTVLDSAAGIAKRESDAKKKREANKKARNPRSKKSIRKGRKTSVIEESEEEAEADGEVEEEGVSVPTREPGRDDSADLTSASSWRLPGVPISSFPLLSRTHHLYLETFVPFGAVLGDPDRTSLSIECSRAEVQAFMEREIATLNTIVRLVRNRRRIGKALLEKMDAEIAALDGVLLDELAGSSDLDLDLKDSDDEVVVPVGAPDGEGPVDKEEVEVAGDVNVENEGDDQKIPGGDDAMGEE